MSFKKTPMSSRFRGYLPVVVDIETAGFDPKNNAVLEIAAVIPEMDEHGLLKPCEVYSAHVNPFPGSRLDESALAFNKIDPYHPLRIALDEKDALEKIFQPVRTAVKRNSCTRAILVGHNPAFDIGFLNAAVSRCNIKKNPFHPFSTFDTATLGGLAYCQTVLAKAVMAAGIEWDNAMAHSAMYDAEQTALLFCTIVNRWNELITISENCSAGASTKSQPDSALLLQ
jgi:ribonuclease T